MDFGSGKGPDETGGWCRMRHFLMFEGLPRFPEVSFYFCHCWENLPLLNIEMKEMRSSQLH